MAMPEWLADTLDWGGYLADSPGALLRGGIGNLADVLSGEDKQHGFRASTRDLLEQRFGAGPNEDDIDTADVLGFIGDMVLDPTNLIGAGLFRHGAKAAKAANKGIQRVIDANVLADEANLGIDAMRQHADQMLRDPEYARHATPTHYRDWDRDEGWSFRPIAQADLNKVPDYVQEMFGKGESVTDMSQQDMLNYMYGSRQQAADALAKKHGYKMESPHSITAKLGEGGEFSTFSYHSPAENIHSNLPIAELSRQDSPWAADLIDELVNEKRYEAVRSGDVPPQSRYDDAILSGDLSRDQYLSKRDSLRLLDRPPSAEHTIGTLGFVYPGRPDVVFASNSVSRPIESGSSLVERVRHLDPAVTNTVTHEAVHSFQHSRPEEFRAFLDLLGNRPIKHSMASQFGDGAAAVMQVRNPEKYAGEGAALEVGNLSQHLAESQRNAVLDAMTKNSPDIRFADFYAVDDLSRYVDSERSRVYVFEALRKYMDYLQGNYLKREHAISDAILANSYQPIMPAALQQGPSAARYLSALAPPNASRYADDLESLWGEDSEGY